MNTTTLIQETLQRLVSQAPEHHANIRQALYDHLNLPLNKQLRLYTSALGPASSGKFENQSHITKGVESALTVLHNQHHK
ncbi:PAS factor family protein [Vibrio maerlii]|uniref:PAS factor family protein n=1 Tax=Vibrio maerlii TaxID=2231648 RepID=UPI000E3DEAFA|nr:PAS factor family protein [Vibrio maerlii]